MTLVKLSSAVGLTKQRTFRRRWQASREISCRLPVRGTLSTLPLTRSCHRLTILWFLQTFMISRYHEHGDERALQPVPRRHPSFWPRKEASPPELCNTALLPREATHSFADGEDEWKDDVWPIRHGTFPRTFPAHAYGYDFQESTWVRLDVHHTTRIPISEGDRIVFRTILVWVDNIWVTVYTHICGEVDSL
ncbi:hypothetical protein BDZ89DRAFT_270292 [Hymenopellis radicata]|nr:hypothetical protein BDZ89DRAFT_270292 [Hymenopellis radicata]